MFEPCRVHQPTLGPVAQLGEQLATGEAGQSAAGLTSRSDLSSVSSA